MNPEQRLSIREAVDLIAQHGEKPISESALRSRAKTKRLGVSRVNGRIYTNPLNLASAGLIPIDVVTAAVVPPAIDDDELRRWLGGPDAGSDADPPGPLERLLDTGSTEAPTADPTTGARQGESHGRTPDKAGFEDTVDSFLDDGTCDDDTETLTPVSHEAAARTQPSSADQSAGVPRRSEAAHTPGVSSADSITGQSAKSSRMKARRRPVLVGVLGVIATLIGVLAAVGGSSGGSLGPGPAASGAVAAADSERHRQAAAIEAADDRGDFDLVMRLASSSGDRTSFVAAREDAARALLARARHALDQGRVRTARRYVRRVEERYDDADPSKRRSVEDRIRRAERAAERERAREAAAKRARQALVASRRRPSATPEAASTTPPAPVAAEKPTATTPVAPTNNTEVPAPSKSAEKANTRSPEFF